MRSFHVSTYGGCSRNSRRPLMRFLLDTNIVSDLVKHPQGVIADRISAVGEKRVCTSIIVAAELRYGAAKKASARLTGQLDAVLAAIDVLAFESPCDLTSGRLRATLEKRAAGRRQRPADCSAGADAPIRSSLIMTANSRV